MKAYSYDLRLRVLRAVDQGRSRAEIVAMFAVSLATPKRYLKRQRETGDVRTKPIPGRPAKKGAALRAGLLSQLDTYPDATLAEHCQNLEQFLHAVTCRSQVLIVRKVLKYAVW